MSDQPVPPNWCPLGEIRQENAIAKVHFARITKTFEGLAKTVFTTAGNDVVQIHRLADPLRSMVVASALSVDTALEQDSRGFG